MNEFRSTDFLPVAIATRLTEVRIQDPDLSLRSAKGRKRRARIAPDGRLNILAADHPARRVTATGGDPLGMADRRDFLARVTRVLMSDVVDGVMATMDILEDLLALHDLLSGAGGPPFLDDKLLIASLNRGGLAQVCWEMNDPMTGASPATCAAWGLDGGKILLRICDEDPGSLATMLETARAITELNALKLSAFLEPLPAVKAESGYKVVKTVESLARIAGVASALGDSSRYLWLKLPYCEDYATVARATTLPILLLGGESAGGAGPFLEQLTTAASAAPNVRGALVGRSVLYPGTDDPLAVAEVVGAVVHRGWTLDQALEGLAAHRGRDMDWLTRPLAQKAPWV